jgi:hypothetical protein
MADGKPADRSVEPSATLARCFFKGLPTAASSEKACESKLAMPPADGALVETEVSAGVASPPLGPMLGDFLSYPNEALSGSAECALLSCVQIELARLQSTLLHLNEASTYLDSVNTCFQLGLELGVLRGKVGVIDDLIV